MSIFRQLAHLQEQLGEYDFAVLIDSANTGRVKAFVATLTTLPTEIVLNGRAYEFASFLRDGETSVTGDVMVERAKEMNANLGEEDGKYFLRYQAEIPAALRGRVVFVFTDWRDPDSPRSVFYVCWHEDSRRWIRLWRSLVSDWYGKVRLPRRKT